MSARVRCPTCRRDVDWDAAPFRPFCSERCRLIDLGKWASGGYVISSPVTDAEEAIADRNNDTEDQS